MGGDPVVIRYLETQGCVELDTINGFEVWRAATKKPMYYYVKGVEIYSGTSFEKKQRLGISLAEIKKSLRWEK
jgi:hypothetical protein